ncbi:MAG: AraC family transcriptional regulator [Planctomycetota bacterium]
MSLEEFVGDDLLRGIAALHQTSLLGPWPQTQRGHRRSRNFHAAFYGEDHAHGHLELCLLLSGQCAMSYDFQHYLLRAGDLGFFPPHLAHAETYWRADQPYVLAWWTLAAERTLVHVTRYARRSGWRMAERVELRNPTQETRAALRRLKQFITQTKTPQVTHLKEALLTVVVAMLRHLMAHGGEVGNSARQSVIDQAQVFIAKHPARTLTIAEVAREVLLSPNYLTTLFRTETGVSLGNYIKRERIRQAKKLLANTARSIKAIAFDLGFDDPYTFSRTFKRVEGISPQQFRVSAPAAE